jgi:bifunctional DNA-binding transcriptional regulator/antitoxin component of YhaV-PrlF toxin-antitoxin module
MSGDVPIGDAKMQPNRGITVPVEVAEHWGLEKGDRTTLYFFLDRKGRVLVVPGEQLKKYYLGS